MIRRQTHQAGESWRKWGPPLIVGPPAPEVRPLMAIAFWLACCWDGAILALTLRGMGL